MIKHQLKKIFIVDDDPFWTIVLMQMLEDIGFQNIKTFPGGVQCLKNMYQHPSLVFLDYQMEEMNGLETLKRIKAYAPRTGVILCSANETMGVAIDAMKNGSYDYLIKSKCGINELSIVLNELGNSQIFSEKIF